MEFDPPLPRLEFDPPLPYPFTYGVVWAKPDLARIRIIVSAVKDGKCYELGGLRVVSRPPPPKEAAN